MDISSAIHKGSKILKKNLIPNSQLDAEILMAKTIDRDRNFILLNPNNHLNKKDQNNFYKLIESRSLGNPIAYLTNKKYFWNSEFFVSDDVLIRFQSWAL